MKKKLLATFQVGGFTVPVYLIDGKVMEKEKAIGCASGDLLAPEVWLDERISGERLNVVLLHEMLHVVGDEYGADLDEKQVEALSTGLRQAFTTLKPAKKRKK